MSEYLLNPSEPTPANKMKFDDYLPDTLKLSVIFRLPAELGKYIRICKSMAAPMRRWSQCGHSPTTLRAPGTGSVSAACLWLMSGPTRATWTPHCHRVFRPLPSSTPPTPTRCISSSAPASCRGPADEEGGGIRWLLDAQTTTPFEALLSLRPRMAEWPFMQYVMYTSSLFHAWGNYIFLCLCLVIYIVAWIMHFLTNWHDAC